MQLPNAIAAAVIVGSGSAMIMPNTTAPAPYYANMAITTSVTKYITYCPKPTSFTGPDSKIYAITESTWVTVTCPQTCPLTYIPGPFQTVYPIVATPPYGNGTGSGNLTSPTLCPSGALTGSCPSGSGSNGSGSGSGSGNSSALDSGSVSGPGSGSGSGAPGSGLSDSESEAELESSTGNMPSSPTIPADFQGIATGMRASVVAAVIAVFGTILAL